jgi:ornithine cyclodeaminase/alanine dehydrogenase-like protein (mu-crystallin family)
LIETVSQENDARWESDCSFHFIDTTASDFQQQIQSRLSDIDCVFCTTPSREALFPASYLTKRNSNGRQPFISAIGSWQSDMLELDPALLHHAIASETGYNPASGYSSGVVLVDDRDYALHNSGEVVQSKVTANDMVELGQIVALRSGKTKPLNSQHITQTNAFISQGFVVYKSIGVGLTDLTAANATLALRKKKQHHL